MKTCFLRITWPKYMSVRVLVLPVLFMSDRRREGSKRAVLLPISWECSWVEDSNLYSVPREGKTVRWDSTLPKHYGFCSRDQKNRTWERPSTCTFLDTESISWETQIWRKQEIVLWKHNCCLVHAELFACFKSLVNLCLIFSFCSAGMLSLSYNFFPMQSHLTCWSLQ